MLNEKKLKEIQSEIKIEIETLAKDYELGNVSPSFGKGKYEKIFWWRIVFNDNVKTCLKDVCQDYEGIHFMPYFVGQELLDAVNSLDKECTLPDIDKKSGNLHPVWGDEEVEKWCEAPAVKQVVLVKSHTEKNGAWGPLKAESSEEANLSDGEIKFSDIADPCCYYPPTDSNSDCDFTTEELLKRLLMQVLDKEKVMKKFDKESKLYQLMSEEE